MVVGEPLLELSSDTALERATTLGLSFSGDALNAAAAAAAAGAVTQLVTRVGEDEISARLLGYAAGLGVGTDGVTRGPEPMGAYLVGADPDGQRDFVYLRSGSAATRMVPADLPTTLAVDTAVLIVSGIAMAASPSLADTVVAAARTVHEAGGQVVYDPNFRRRLTDPRTARGHLRRLVPYLSLVVPSVPSDTEALVDTADVGTAVARLRELGVGDLVLTAGTRGAHLARAGEPVVHVPPVPADVVVDATGAGDVFLGTLAAALVRGPLSRDAVRRASAAASFSVGGRGGTGRLAAPATVQELLRRA